MKATKQATHGTFSRSAPARGKFGKVCLVLLLLVTAVFCGFAPRAWALEQNAEGVYELRTPQELKAFRDLVNGGKVGANAKLTADIDLRDLGDEPWTPIGTGPSNPYKGTFDGGGFTVRGVKVNNGVEYPGFGMCAGFFGFISGSVKNLNVSGEIAAESSGNIYIGGIAGSAQFNGPNITNCSFFGSVSADSAEGDVCAGGVVGQMMFTEIAGCTYTGGSVTAVCGGKGANNRVGGIVGQASNSTIVGCTASSEKISASGEYALNMAGGIVGNLDFAAAANCTAASAAISAEGTNSNDAGGITGNAFNGKMSGCAYTGGAGSITAARGDNNTGGISGALKDDSSVSNCAWNGDSSEKATGMGDNCVVEETTTALPAEEFKSGEIILSVIPACPVVNLTPGRSSTLSFTAYPSGKPLTQEQAAKYISVPETEYSTFSIDTSAWPYVVTGTDVGTEELVFSFYATNIVTGKPAEDPTGSVTMTVVNAVTPAVPVTGISGITPAELSMPAGGTQQLAAAVTPANATDNLSAITWSSDDETVATVDENGVVTAVAPGSATITAEANGETATCAVTVSASPQPAPPSGGGSGGGGGCSAGFGALALLAAVPLLARRKK